MQVGPSIDIAVLGLPGIILGLLSGYVIGGMPNFRFSDRLFLGIVISGIGGLILALGINVLFPMDSLTMVFVVISFFGGYFLGLILNWEPPDNSKSKHHIVYEPDDDDTFDREIEDALGGNK